MLSTLMKQVGRHRGFLVGCFLGAGGASLAAVGLHASSFALIVVGAFFIGVGSAGTQLIRFVALEVVSEEWKPRAPPLVLVGGLLGAFLGPYMALRTSKEHTIVSGNDFAGTYWVMAGGETLPAPSLLPALMALWTDRHAPHGPAAVSRSDPRTEREDAR